MYLLRIHDVNLKHRIIELGHNINFEDGKNECTKTITT